MKFQSWSHGLGACQTTRDADANFEVYGAFAGQTLMGADMSCYGFYDFGLWGRGVQ